MSVLAALAVISSASQAEMHVPFEVISGNVRVQVLSPTLVRIEEKGPHGFEDRTTFTVVRRPRAIELREGSQFPLGDYVLEVPPHASVRDVRITDPQGKTVFQWDGKPIWQPFLPGPSDPFAYYAIQDNPRVVPPSWGATPPPATNTDHADTSGWDVTNDATDIYIFLRGGNGYAGVRGEFLNVTGHTPMPPLAAFGFWDSRYYEYKQQEALDLIDTYRRRGYPLDYFVVDTDWRVNGSHGYQINTKDFPDMAGFIRDAHARHVHLMYNDHPEPITENALDPKEFEYRWKGLTSLLDMGMDTWWYDRNWSTHLHEPAPGLRKEVWGAAIFHDMTLRARPDRRPLLMSNVEGIDNGIRNYGPHPTFHRYPIWWTGDTTAYWSYLQRGIQNGVDSGVISLLPYVNEDLGGHMAHPTSELYVRYLQYGCLSPITRIHCTKGEDRHPWIFGREAESIVKRFIKLRYRLLPTIYGASRRAYEDGTPLLRRCDLEWPSHAEAASGQQYLLGDDILVAPTNEGLIPTAVAVPTELLHTTKGEPGLLGEYFANPDLKGTAALTRVDPAINFDWKAGSPGPNIPNENFSVRWSGKLGPMPESGDYYIDVRSDDGFRLFLDGRDVLEDWRPRAEMASFRKIHFERGKVYDLGLEYEQLGGDDTCYFEWVVPSRVRSVVTRTLWIPPGQWEDLWTGELLSGPRSLTVESPLWHCPMYIRRGGLVLQAPEMNYTGEKAWDPVTIDAYPLNGTDMTRALYEDDGASNEYLNGAFRVTPVRLSSSGNTVALSLGAASGSYANAISERAWIVRVHLLPRQKVSSVLLDGVRAEYKVLHADTSHVEIPFAGAGTRPGHGAGDVVEITLPPLSVVSARQIEIKF